MITFQLCMIGGDSVEDEVELPQASHFLLFVSGKDDFVGAEAERVFLLAWRGGENNETGSERMRKLYPM